MTNRIKPKFASRTAHVPAAGGSGLVTLVVLLLGMMVAGLAAGQAPAEAVTQGDFDYDAQTLRVGVWLPELGKDDVLQKGEYFSVGFQANEDAYAVVYRIDTEGAVTVLWPRSRMDDGFVFGGHEYILPVAGAKRLAAGDLAGEGFIEAIVSIYPFDLRDLELDFHHESNERKYNFQVAGDPYLAMNEVNFVVTGLEDSGDYVVTNYVSYYVHQQVDHPRYLCNQCHFEEDVAYDPYQDDCTLEIQYDYGWSNTWYDTYGYYPVYSNPVYVYVDPWTWRPWVNFWYDPWYSCAPSWGWGWGYSCYGWYDSPYYWGNCYTYYGNGYRRWGPLDRSRIADGSRTKSREYGGVTSLIGKEKPSDRQREAMRARTTLADARQPSDRDLGRRGAPGGIRGEARADRERPKIETSQVRSNSSGLRIRDNTAVRGGSDTGRSAVRHTAGGNETRSALKPVSRTTSGSGSITPVRGSSSVRTNPNNPRTGADKPANTRTRADKPARDARVRSGQPDNGSRSIKPVEPRRRGTRVWNTRPETQQSDRTRSSSSVRGSSGPDRTKVTPRNNTNRSGSTPQVKPRTTTRSNPASKPANPPKVRSQGSKNNSAAKSSGGSRSTGGKSSGRGGKGGTNQRR